MAGEKMGIHRKLRADKRAIALSFGARPQGRTKNLPLHRAATPDLRGLKWQNPELTADSRFGSAQQGKKTSAGSGKPMLWAASFALGSPWAPSFFASPFTFALGVL